MGNVPGHCIQGAFVKNQGLAVHKARVEPHMAEFFCCPQRAGQVKAEFDIPFAPNPPTTGPPQGEVAHTLPPAEVFEAHGAGGAGGGNAPPPHVHALPTIPRAHVKVGRAPPPHPILLGHAVEADVTKGEGAGGQDWVGVGVRGPGYSSIPPHPLPEHLVVVHPAHLGGDGHAVPTVGS